MFVKLATAGQANSIGCLIHPADHCAVDYERHHASGKLSGYCKRDKRVGNCGKSPADLKSAQRIGGYGANIAGAQDRKHCRRRQGCGLPRAALSHDSPTLAPVGAPASPRLPAPLSGASYFATDDRPVVLFDGVCNLCNKWVNFLLDYDPNGNLRFAALQSPAGEALLARAGRSIEEEWDIVLVAKDTAYFGTDAIVQMGYKLKDPFPAMAAVASIVPGPLKNYVYRAVSEHKHEIFGLADACRFGDDNFNDRFVV